MLRKCHRLLFREVERQNAVLKSLNVSGNAGITALALRNNPALEVLNASATALTDIDLAANTALTDLNLSECAGITVIDLAANTALVELNVLSTALTSLDVTNNSSIITLDYTYGIRIISGFNIGHPIVANGDNGVVFFVSETGMTTKVVSLDEKSGQTFDQARQWVREKGNHWTLPNIDDLTAIYNNKKTLNSTLSTIGGIQFNEGNYWSSETYTWTNSSGRLYYYVYLLSFSNGKRISYTYDYNEYVRAIKML